MKKRMLIGVSEDESSVAVVEDGVLQDLHIERVDQGGIKGNIYKGTIVKVEPALQAAFVDFGSWRNGFLAIDDIQPRWFRKPAPKGQRPRIQDVLAKGQEVMVQVTKEPIGNKGAALTTFISLPGRYLVLMPHHGGGGGVSRKIEDDAARTRLKDLLKKIRPTDNHGLIIRTAGLDRTKAELEKDLATLLRLSGTISSSFNTRNKGLVFREQDVVIRVIRDYYDPDTQEVLIDDEEAYNRVVEYVQVTIPRHVRRFKLYEGQAPLFVAEGIERQIDAIYSNKVTLSSGGAIVLESTEAMVTIDVNSGRSLGERGVEETAFKTNLEAAQEVARQLRLRDLGGLVVVDFIDMRDDKHCRAVERELKVGLKPDKAKTHVGRISSFGLLELSRQRIRPTLQMASLVPCPLCAGKGMVVSPESGARRALRRMKTELADPKVSRIKAVLPKEEALFLLNGRRSALIELERSMGVTIQVVPGRLGPGDIGQFELTRDENRAVPQERKVSGGFKEDVEGPDLVPEASPEDSEVSASNVPSGRRESGRQEVGTQSAGGEGAGAAAPSSPSSSSPSASDASGSKPKRRGGRRRSRGKRGGERTGTTEEARNGSRSDGAGEGSQGVSSGAPTKGEGAEVSQRSAAEGGSTVDGSPRSRRAPDETSDQKQQPSAETGGQPEEETSSAKRRRRRRRPSSSATEKQQDPGRTSSDRGNTDGGGNRQAGNTDGGGNRQAGNTD